MKKVWDQLKIDPWDYEIELRIEQGMERWEATGHVVSRWMRAGDLRPLSAIAKRQGVLRGPILGLLVQMIDEGRLVVPAGRGRPQDPEADARDEFAADTYEEFLKDPIGVGSDDLFGAVARVCGVSEQVVRQAVTARRSRSA
jgi:hypothetical protein